MCIYVLFYRFSAFHCVTTLCQNKNDSNLLSFSTQWSRMKQIYFKTHVCKLLAWVGDFQQTCFPKSSLTANSLHAFVVTVFWLFLWINSVILSVIRLEKRCLASDSPLKASGGEAEVLTYRCRTEGTNIFHKKARMKSGGSWSGPPPGSGCTSKVCPKKKS